MKILKSNLKNKGSLFYHLFLSTSSGSSSVELVSQDDLEKFLLRSYAQQIKEKNIAKGMIFKLSKEKIRSNF